MDEDRKLEGLALPPNRGLMYLFRIHVIGGRTGATEGGWFFMVCWMVGGLVVLALGVSGYKTDAAVDFLKFTLPFALGAWLITNGFKNALQSGLFGSQRPPDPPDRYIE